MMSLENRRTVRSYTSQKIEDALLHKLLERACHAANTGNMQWYSVVVTTSEAGKKALAPAHFNQPQCTGAAAVVTFCADLNRFSRWCELRQAEPGYDNFQSFIAAAIDTTIAAQAFATEAEAEGLGTCFLGTTTYNAQAIIDALRLPRLVVPITTLTAGYPADPLPDTSERLPLESILHDEAYKDYSSNDIDRFYAEKERLNRRFVEENGKQTLAQVFTDIRYTKAANEAFSEEFLKVLRNQGLL